MKIFLPNISEQEIGGAFTWQRNLRRALEDKVQFVNSWQDCDVYLIASVTLADRDEVEEVAAAGKVIIFRVDNIPKKSRNKRSRVYDNMRRYSELAAMVVYQSQWAENYASVMCHPETPSTIIYNGVDRSIFYPAPEPDEEGFSSTRRHLFVQYNRDENKRFPEAALHFHRKHRTDKQMTLTIVGKFSPDNFNPDGTPHFDFFDGEKIAFVPPVNDPTAMADIYRQHDILLFPAFADAAPNTCLEARACGLAVELVNPEGGTKEMLDPDLDISLERMADEYLGMFNILTTKHVVVAG